METYIEYQKQVLDCTLWLSDHGFFGALRGTGGNVSVRIPGQDAFAITPSSIPYRDLAPGDICIVDFDLQQIRGDYGPSMEAGMHLKVYQHRPDVNAVVHTHQPEASVFSLLNRPIPALFDEVVLSLGPVVEIIPYALSGSPELAENVAAAVGNGGHGYLIQNHGILCLGATLEKAWLNAELLEKTAQTYSRALATGMAVSTLPEDIVGLLAAIRKEARKKAVGKK